MVKIGIVGLGHWGPNYVRNFSHFPERVRIAAVSDLNAQSFNKISRLLSGAAFYEDWKKMLQREQLDAVIISTPADTHFAIARACLLADKDVLVEKPLALRVREAETLVELAKKKNGIL